MINNGQSNRTIKTIETMRSLFIGYLLLSTINAFCQKKLPNKNIYLLNNSSSNIEKEIDNHKITIISFWATWCVPCLNELDTINEVYEEWQDELNIELIAISTDDSRSQKRVKALVNGKGWPYKVLLDKNQELKRALNIHTIPELIIVKGGKIIYRHSGYSPGFEDELYEIIKENS